MSTYFQNAPEGWFVTEKRIQRNLRGTSYKQHNDTARGFHVHLEGDEITSKEDFEHLKNIFSARHPEEIAKVALGPLERPTNNKNKAHQHFFILNKNYNKVYWPEIIEFPSGNKSIIYAMPLSEYSQETGDVEKLINYIEKSGEKCLFKEFNDKNLTVSKKQDDHKESWNRAVRDAIEKPDWIQAKKILENKNIEKFMMQEAKIKQQWLKKHSREIDMDMTYKEKLLPWKDMKELDIIRAWMNKAASAKSRSGNLFIIGPTKTGKTEFIIQEGFRKFPSFMLRGDFMWERYDEESNYKFYILDDIDYNSKTIPQIKALTSSVDIPTMINVKYGHALVKSRPCIHLLNDNEFRKFKRIANWNGGDKWWPRNSTVIKIKERVFKLPSQLENEKLLNQEDTMSENSINEFDDENQEVEENNNNEEEKSTDSEEQNNEEDNPEENKKPKPFYTKKKTHSFRSRFKHMLRKLNNDEDTVQEYMQRFDEERIKNLKDKEAIEYGFDDIDNIDDNPSMQEEREFEIIQMNKNDKENIQTNEDYEDEEGDETYDHEMYQNNINDYEYYEDDPAIEYVGRLGKKDKGVQYD